MFCPLLTNRSLLQSSLESLRKAGTYHPSTVVRRPKSSSSSGGSGSGSSDEPSSQAPPPMAKQIDRAELKSRLTPLQWHVTQEKGTERPFTGCYNKHYEGGVYSCVVCEQELFSSESKYDSGCGWPAFNDVLEQGRVRLNKDTSLNMVRTEVVCSQCGAHLGHVFNDGPKPKRKRFCINSVSLNFHPAAETKKD